MLAIGMDVTIEANRNGSTKTYKSKVADLQEYKCFIYYPLSVTDKKPAFLPAGSKVIVQFVNNDFNAYSFEAKVIRVHKKAVPLVELTLPEEEHFIKIQRREHVRVSASLEAEFDFAETGQFFNTVTSDISAGGCAAILPPGTDLKPGAQGTVSIAIRMSTGELHTMSLKCEAIRSFERNNIKLVSIKYIEPSPDNQKLLTRFCFERQLSDRKKGLYP
ncbi:flagellar brake protein [Siminovitchia sediminis]|uniref:Flagellar brake protein n=1 Tax=Siminovitchia sediminis TaxID=1274353 RepID=A0ABW4KHC6_9BACI